MKKSILLMLPFAMGLAACSGGSPLDKGNIINEAFMERNFGDYVDVTKEKKVLEKVSIDLGEGFDIVTRVESWFITSDGAGKFGAYNAITNKYEVAPGEYTLVGSATQPFSVLYAGFSSMFFLTYVTEEGEVATRHVVDPSGVEVFAMETDLDYEVAYGKKGVSLYNSYFSDYEREGNEYEVIFAYSYFSLEEGQFAVYNLDGSISRKGKLSEYAAAVGSVYWGMEYESMAEYGHPEISMAVTESSTGAERYAFYNSKEGKFICSVEMPAVEASFIAGDYFVGQYRTLVEERATTYDYFDGTDKYNVHTVRFNYTNGAKEELESKVIFADAVYPTETYVDEKGVSKYAYFNDVRVIGSDKALEPTHYGFILDEKAEVAADVTGIEFDSLEKYGDQYFLVEDLGDYGYALHVYDGKLNEVAYIPYVDASGHVFQDDTGYGLVGYDGKVLLQATASYIDPVMDSEHFLVAYFDKIQLVDISEGEAKVLKELSTEDYAFLVDDEDAPYYVSVEELVGGVLLAGGAITEEEFWEDYYHQALNTIKVAVIDRETSDHYFLDVATGELASANNYGLAETDSIAGYTLAFDSDAADVDLVLGQTAEGNYFALRDVITYTYSFHEFAAK